MSKSLFEIVEQLGPHSFRIHLPRVWQSDIKPNYPLLEAILNPLLEQTRPGTWALASWTFQHLDRYYEGEIQLVMQAEGQQRLSQLPWEESLPQAEQLLQLAASLERDGLNMRLVHRQHFFLSASGPWFNQALYELAGRPNFFSEGNPDQRQQYAHPEKAPSRGIAAALSLLLTGQETWLDYERAKARGQASRPPREKAVRQVILDLADGRIGLKQALQNWNAAESESLPDSFVRVGAQAPDHSNWITPELTGLACWQVPDSKGWSRFRREWPSQDPQGLSRQLTADLQSSTHPSWELRGWNLLTGPEAIRLEFEMDGVAEACLWECLTKAAGDPIDVTTAEAILSLLAEAESQGLDVAGLRPWHIFLRQGQPCLCLPLLKLAPPDPHNWDQNTYPQSPYRDLSRTLRLFLFGGDLEYGADVSDWQTPARVLGEHHPVARVLQRLAPLKPHRGYANLAEALAEWRGLKEPVPVHYGGRFVPQRLAPERLELLRALRKDVDWVVESGARYTDDYDDRGKCYREIRSEGPPKPIYSLAERKTALQALDIPAQDKEQALQLLGQAETRHNDAVVLLLQAMDLVAPLLAAPKLVFPVYDGNRQQQIYVDDSLVEGRCPDFFLGKASIRASYDTVWGICLPAHSSPDLIEEVSREIQKVSPPQTPDLAKMLPMLFVFKSYWRDAVKREDLGKLLLWANHVLHF